VDVEQNADVNNNASCDCKAKGGDGNHISVSQNSGKAESADDKNPRQEIAKIFVVSAIHVQRVRGAPPKYDVRQWREEVRDNNKKRPPVMPNNTCQDIAQDSNTNEKSDADQNFKINAFVVIRTKVHHF